MSQATTHHDQRQNVLILDFGGQTAQLIARRVREAGVFSLLIRPDTPAAEIAARKPAGIILSGGPASVYEPGAPVCDPAIFDLGIPILGICYGMQLAGRLLGATVRKADHREFGRASMTVRDRAGLLHALPEHATVWMSHGDQVSLDDAPAHLKAQTTILASTPTCPLAAVRITREPTTSTKPLTFYGVQFHPEVTHTPQGADIIENFLYEVCRCAGDWRMADYLESTVQAIRARVGKDRVLCGLSGGVDSSV
ncbi:MAG: glutamine-hydrolyzing GMP synthase, partial [bacterium]